MSGQTKRGITAALLDALYPPDVACALCGRETVIDERHLCASCRDSLEVAPALSAQPPFSGMTAAFRYCGSARDGIRALKYHNQVRLASFFADSIIIPHDWKIDAVIPVSLHPLKQWLRSYNQSELIAASLCQRYHISLRTDLLQRNRFTRSQTTLDTFERAKNVAKAFSASPEAKGLNILLVDDVTTTHSTLLSCAVALRASGAERMYAACATVASHSYNGRLEDSDSID